MAACPYTDLAATGSSDGVLRLWKCAENYKSLEPIDQFKIVEFYLLSLLNIAFLDLFLNLNILERIRQRHKIYGERSAASLCSWSGAQKWPMVQAAESEEHDYRHTVDRSRVIGEKKNLRDFGSYRLEDVQKVFYQFLF